MEEEFISLNPEQKTNFASIIDIKEELTNDASDCSGDMEEEEFISLNREQDSNVFLIADIKEEPELILSDSDDDEADSSSEVDDENYSETSSVKAPADEPSELEPINPSRDEGMVSKLSKPLSNDFTLICTKCTELFKNVHHLNNHYFKEHNIGAQVEDLNFKAIERSTGNCYYQCTKCPKNFKGKKLLFLHSTQHDTIKMFRCDNCNKHFNYYKSIKGHNCRNSKKGYSRFVWKHVKRLCPSCGNEYKCTRDLKRHLSHDHKFSDLKNINVVKVKSKQLQFKCTVCDHLFNTRLLADFQTHAFLHMKYKLFNCQQCPITCDAEDEIMRHLYVDHQIEIKSNSNIKLLEMEDVEFQCPDCGVELQSRKAFMDHITVEHRLNTLSGLRMKQLTKIRFECLDCNAILTRYTRIQHRMSHMPYKPYRCGFCKHQLAQGRGAIAHLLKCKRKHLKASLKKESKKKTKKNTDKKKTKKNTDKKINIKKDKSENPLSIEPKVSQVRCAPVMNEFGKYMSYACPECNIPLANATDWHTHISLNHNFFDEDNLNFIKTLDGNLTCTECGILTKGPLSHRQRHKLTHMAHKSYVCTLCGHRSKTRNVLFGHIRRCHFTKGEHKCIVCAEVFETSFKCIEHCKTVHSEHEYPPYSCKICLSVLAHNSSLKKHMRMHEYDRTMYKCVGCARLFLWTTELHKHVREKHPVLYESCVQCKICKSKFYDRLQLEEHLKIHDGAKAKNPKPRKSTAGKRFEGPKRKRPRKLHVTMEDEATTSSETCESDDGENLPKRKIGRTRERKPIAFDSSSEESELTEDGEFDADLKSVPNPDEPKRKRGRPRKIQTAIEIPKNIKCEPHHSVIEYINEDDGCIENDEIAEKLSHEIVKEEFIL